MAIRPVAELLEAKQGQHHKVGHEMEHDCKYQYGWQTIRVVLYGNTIFCKAMRRHMQKISKRIAYVLADHEAIVKLSNKR